MYPFQPGTHPYSHKPFILLQPVHLSGQLLMQSSPQNNLGHPEEKKINWQNKYVWLHVCSCVRDVCIVTFDNHYRHRTIFNRRKILNKRKKQTNIENMLIIKVFSMCFYLT